MRTEERGMRRIPYAYGISEMKNNQQQYDPSGTDPFVPLISESYASDRA